MDHFEGKGDEEVKNTGKSQFRCPHRWSKVSVGLVSLGGSAEIPQAKGPKGTVLIQNCRRCGVFKASLVGCGVRNGLVQIRHQIRYLKNAEGIHTTDFEPMDQGNEVLHG